MSVLGIDWFWFFFCYIVIPITSYGSQLFGLQGVSAVAKENTKNHAVSPGLTDERQKANVDLLGSDISLWVSDAIGKK